MRNVQHKKWLPILLNALIPASADGRIPAAGTLGVASFIEDKLAGDIGLQALFAAAFDLIFADNAPSNDKGGDIVALIKKIEIEQPVFFSQLLRLTYMGYYSRADIRPLFGLSDGPTQPDGYHVQGDDHDEMAALVAPVRGRGPCYRPWPEDNQQKG